MERKSWMIITIILAIVFAASLFYVFGGESSTSIGFVRKQQDSRILKPQATGSYFPSFPAYPGGWWGEWGQRNWSGDYTWIPSGEVTVTINGYTFPDGTYIAAD